MAKRKRDNMAVIDLEVVDQQLFTEWKNDVDQIIGALQYGVYPAAVKAAALYAQYQIDVGAGGKYEDISGSSTKYYAGAGAQIVAALADLALAVTHMETAATNSTHNILPDILEAIS